MIAAVILATTAFVLGFATSTLTQAGLVTISTEYVPTLHRAPLSAVSTLVVRVRGLGWSTTWAHQPIDGSLYMVRDGAVVDANFNNSRASMQVRWWTDRSAS